MSPQKVEVVPIDSDEDIVRVRQSARAMAIELGFSLVEQTKVVTAASELARNALIHGGGGQAWLEMVSDGGTRRGLCLLFEDQGPGIADVELAMKEGYTTGNGLGYGLSGAKKLSHDFEITSEPGAGTRVRIIRWK